MLCTSSQLNSIPQGLFTVNTFASIKPRGVRDTWLGWSKCIDLGCCGRFGSAPGCVDRHSVTPGVTATSAPRFLFHIQPYTSVISTLIPWDIWPSVSLWLNQYPNEQVSAWYWHTVSGNVEQSRESVIKSKWSSFALRISLGRPGFLSTIIYSWRHYICRAERI